MLVWIILEITQVVCDKQDVSTEIYWECVPLFNTRYIETVDSLAWKMLMLDHPFIPF